MALKEYNLKIVYNTDNDEIEYIEEYISGDDIPALIPYPDKLEVDDKYWDMVNTNEVAES
tara:strand:- start:466 stop:645 length:180 start_codon:yes stop_codon:yes gene_type:complete